MATESRPGLTGHLRSVTTTTLASLSGVLAALVSAAVVGTSDAAVSSPRQVFVVGAFILAQFVVHRAIGIDVDDYGAKDYLYIAFMTFALWFISLAIILTAGVQIALTATVPAAVGPSASLAAAGLFAAPAGVSTTDGADSAGADDDVGGEHAVAAGSDAPTDSPTGIGPGDD
jgi:hypothetical protein